ncbi:hypothetical protein Hanom_Chr04g00334881 [Helianthus anomalus]
MIPYVWLISAMIVQQNRLLENLLWVVKHVDDFDFAKMRKGSHIYFYSTGHRHKIFDRDTRFTYEYTEKVEGEDAEMEEGDEEDKSEEEGRRGPRQRFARRHHKVSNSGA